MTHAKPKAFFTLLLVSLLTLGCGPTPDPKPMLMTLGEIQHTMHEVVEALEAGDGGAIDEIMHGANFRKPFEQLKLNSKQSGLPETAQATLLEAKDELWSQLQTIHDSAHGGGSLEGVDVEAVTGDIEAAMAKLSGALPAGLKIPEVEHGDHDHDDHDHDDHDHEDHDHEDHDHEDGAEHANE